MDSLITQLAKSGEYRWPFGKYIMSNWDHTIDPILAEEVKHNKTIYSYPATDFHADIIWKDGKYICEVWQFHIYQDTIESESLQEIMDICCSRWGNS